jgi:hypothetical protein
MMKANEICEVLIQKSRVFLEGILMEEDIDDNMAAFDRFLEEREPLISLLNQQPKEQDDEDLKTLFELDHRIRLSLMGWMDETKGSLEELSRQRDSYVKVKRSQGGYNKQQSSSEGYFIDKKK